jgi:hypothetical protein
MSNSLKLGCVSRIKTLEYLFEISWTTSELGELGELGRTPRTYSRARSGRNYVLWKQAIQCIACSTAHIRTGAALKVAIWSKSRLQSQVSSKYQIDLHELKFLGAPLYRYISLRSDGELTMHEYDTTSNLISRPGVKVVICNLHVKAFRFRPICGPAGCLCK